MCSKTSSMSNVDVDVVYTWVDGSAPELVRRRNLYRPGPAVPGGKSAAGAREHAGSRRNLHADHGEIVGSVGSVRKYMPWVRKIFIVTSQPFTHTNLVVENSGTENGALNDASAVPVVLVEDKSLFRAAQFENHWPSFNSHAFECHLHRIAGLSRHFIYFNDDMFVGKPLEKSDFFAADELPCVFVNSAGAEATETCSKAFTSDVSLLARANVTSLLKERIVPLVQKEKFLEFSAAASGASTSSTSIATSTTATIHLRPSHHPAPLTKSICIEAWRLFGDRLEQTSSRRFRSRFDVNPVGLFQRFALLTKRAVPRSRDLSDLFIPLSTPFVAPKDVFSLVKSENPRFFCLNSAGEIDCWTERDWKQFTDNLPMLLLVDGDQTEQQQRKESSCSFYRGERARRPRAAEPTFLPKFVVRMLSKITG